MKTLEPIYPHRIREYPPKPENATHYQHRYGYEIPMWLGKWEWSCTFGQWGRIVGFYDGWHGYTWPKTW